MFHQEPSPLILKVIEILSRLGGGRTPPLNTPQQAKLKFGAFIVHILNSALRMDFRKVLYTKGCVHGQSQKIAGVDLINGCFSQPQLYV